MNNPTWEFLSGDLMMPGDAKIDSPIERAFFRCFHYVGLGLPEQDRLQLRRQVSVGRYRVDFLIEDGEGRPLLVVECDGHAFHDATKEQAARDKSRDRDLLMALGQPVMRFTGSELYANPFECAAQAYSVAYRAHGTAA